MVDEFAKAKKSLIDKNMLFRGNINIFYTITKTTFKYVYDQLFVLFLFVFVFFVCGKLEK